MYSHNQAPWAQSGPGNQMQQGPRPGSTQQAWGQQQQPQPNMQNNNQFSGFNGGPSGQQPWNGGQQNHQPLNQASGQPWLAQNQGGPGQQPQNFPPYYQQQAQQAQQQPQQIGQPQLPQQQQGQQQFSSQQQSMASSAAPWGGGQQNQPWQQQAPPQQQLMLQQQLSGPQGMPGPKVITAQFILQACHYFPSHLWHYSHASLNQILSLVFCGLHRAGLGQSPSSFHQTMVLLMVKPFLLTRLLWAPFLR